jgi:hypothetical protein
MAAALTCVCLQSTRIPFTVWVKSLDVPQFHGSPTGYLCSVLVLECCHKHPVVSVCVPTLCVCVCVCVCVRARVRACVRACVRFERAHSSVPLGVLVESTSTYVSSVRRWVTDSRVSKSVWLNFYFYRGKQVKILHRFLILVNTLIKYLFPTPPPSHHFLRTLPFPLCRYHTCCSFIFLLHMFFG